MIATSAGCPSKTPTTVGASNRPRPAEPASSVRAVDPLASPTTGLPPATASLAGLVKAPTEVLDFISKSKVISNNGGSVISNNGGSIISDNGGSIISDQGGSFISKSKLLAQGGVAGAVVHLYKASGDAVQGPDGQPLAATTDASGRYAFTQPLPAGPLVVRVGLPAGAGSLSALAIQGAAPEVDVASTLTTTYILDRYVKTQKDPNATLAKLPAPEEALTRQRALDATSQAQISVVDALSPAKVVAAVEALRKADKPFDAQLEHVRELLVDAGQADLGAGRPGTEVVVDGIRSLAATPDGGLVIHASYDARVWKLGKDGLLRTLLGVGVGDGPEAAHGLAANAIRSWAIEGLAVDPQGRLLVAESPSECSYDPSYYEESDDFGRIYRVDAAGKLEMLWDQAKGSQQWPRILAADADGSVQALCIHGDTGKRWPAQHWRIAPDRSRTLVRRFADADSDLMYGAVKWGRDARGRFVMLCYVNATPPAIGANMQVYRYDPAKDGLEKLADRDGEKLRSLTVTASGEIVALGTDRRVELRGSDDVRRTVLAALPADLDLDGNAGALAADGTLYLVLDKGPTHAGSRAFDTDNALVYRLRDGQLTLAAGVEHAHQAGATDISLADPGGAAAAADGRLFVTDSSTHQVWVVDAQHQARIYAGTGAKGGSGDGGPATQAQLTEPERPVVDGTGRLLWIENERGVVRQVTPDGKIGTRYQPSGDLRPFDLAVRPDGTLYVLEEAKVGFSLVKLAPGATAPETLATGKELQDAIAIAAAPDGSIYITGGTDHNDDFTGWCRRWTPAGGLGAPVANTRFFTDDSGLAVDAKGRLYVFSDDADDPELNRYDPADGSFTVVAGPEGYLKDVVLQVPGYPSFAPNGDLVYTDGGTRQALRIPANALERR